MSFKVALSFCIPITINPINILLFHWFKRIKNEKFWLYLEVSSHEGNKPTSTECVQCFGHYDNAKKHKDGAGFKQQSVNGKQKDEEWIKQDTQLTFNNVVWPVWANGSNYTQIFLTHVLLVCEICSCLGPTIGNDGEGNSTHSSTLAWRIPGMADPGGLRSMGSWRVGHDWATSLSLFPFMPWRRQWQPNPMFLPGECQGQRSLVGSHRVGHNWSNLAVGIGNEHQQILISVVSPGTNLPQIPRWGTASVCIF